MIVVADTSPLNYLIQIEEVDLLPLLFGTVLIPQAVFNELRHPLTPHKVQEWSKKLPLWIEVHRVQTVNDPLLIELDPENAKQYSWP
jgi:predicted nucleic acid-binding protein